MEHWPAIKLTLFQKIEIKHTSVLICRVVFLSRKVTVCGVLFTVSKSMVIPKGIAISSVRAYRRPIDPLESSTLCVISNSVSADADLNIKNIRLNYVIIGYFKNTNSIMLPDNCLQGQYENGHYEASDGENQYQGSLLTIKLKPLSGNPTKWSNTLTQLSVFDHFWGLMLKGLAHFRRSSIYQNNSIYLILESQQYFSFILKPKNKKTG